LLFNFHALSSDYIPISPLGIIPLGIKKGLVGRKGKKVNRKMVSIEIFSQTPNKRGGGAWNSLSSIRCPKLINRNDGSII